MTIICCPNARAQVSEAAPRGERYLQRVVRCVFLRNSPAALALLLLLPQSVNALRCCHGWRALSTRPGIFPFAAPAVSFPSANARAQVSEAVLHGERYLQRVVRCNIFRNALLPLWPLPLP
jgi:hypothetical protein